MSLTEIFREKYFFRKGQKFLQKRNFSKAFYYFQKAVLLNSSAQNLFYLALTLMAQGDYREAEKYFSKVYDKFPDNELNALSFAECLLMRKKWDKAIEIYRRLVSANPQKPAYSDFLKRAEDVVERERYVKAKWLFREAETVIEEKNHKKALELLEEAFRLNPKDANIANNIGSIYFSQKKFPEAFFWFEKAVTLSPSNRKFQKNFLFVKKNLKK
jgi:tetratricopeptide (TPR) repeat protein